MTDQAGAGLSRLQSTLPARGSDDRTRAVGHLGVSIHAPREGAMWYSFLQGVGGGFSIHAPREGERPHNRHTRRPT